MSTAALVPVSEYLSTTYRPDREYVDGIIVERNVGEWDHGNLLMIVSAYLFNRRQQWGIHVVPEQRVQVTPARFRVPDICVVAGPKPDEMILTRPPFLCIEILSKDDTMTQMQERIGDYLAFGVRNVWVLDPRTRRASAFTKTAIQEFTEGDLTTTDPDITLPLAEIFGS